MSINYIGRVIHNIKDFYSEINGATLTGAIDVVVVQQLDGNYTCSPFHVRFGKLGVLRSKEKIVDIEINGDPQDIHMKLGESGEAFFVEELLDSDNEEIPEHLATSPIPISHFEEIYKSNGRRRNSIDLGGQQNNPESKVIQNEINDYTKRRNTTDNENNKKKLEREFIQRQIDLGNIEVHETSMEDLVKQNSRDELIFNMDDDVDTKIVEVKERSPRTLRSLSTPAPMVNTPVVVDLVDTQVDTTLVQHDKRSELVIGKAEESISNESSKSGKKKRRKKPNMKKKVPSRKYSSGLEGSGNFETESVTDGNQTTKDSNETEDKSNSLTSSTTSSDGASQQDLKDPATVANATPTLLNEDSPVSPNDISNCSSKKVMDPDFHFFSDTELTSTHQDDDYDFSRSNTPTATDNVQSDTEFEVKKSKDGSDGNINRDGKNWTWGELPTKQSPDNATGAGLAGSSAPTKEEQEHNSMLSSMFSFMKHSNRRRGVHQDGGVYLADISSGAIDPEVVALYFTGNKKKDADMDCESGNGPSLAQSPVLLQSSPNNSPEGCKSIDSDFDDQLKMMKISGSSDVALSLCGWQPTPPTQDSFLRHLVSFSDLCNDPIILDSSNLVVRVRDRYYTWKVAAPLICASVIYQRSLPQSTIDQLCTMFMPKVDKQEQMEKEQKEKDKGYSWTWYWRRSRRSISTAEGVGDKKKTDNTPHKSTIVTVEENDCRLREMKVDIEAPEDGYHGSNSGSDHGHLREQKNDPKTPPTSEKCRKSLRLTSEQIKRLNLKDGINKVEFTVTTAYQGTSRCNCYIYKWKWNDKIVISDIDGTITKSDVLGHILPIVGKDWAQSGVAELFNKIHSNGYKLLYLSARAIGQSRTTRDYLRSIKQGPGDLSLPDGPVLLNPTSLLTAFHREVIEKKPEKFKISCMSDIRALFPNHMQPFYAGYGNRINDVWAYTAVGIPIVRIFTINPKGELKHELTQTFQSSYMNMIEISDLIFPPLPDAAFEYSQFMHWRNPVPSIDELDLQI